MRRSSWGLSSAEVMDWRIGAACRGADPEAWTMGTARLTDANRTALAICRSLCPVRRQCLAWYESLDPDMRRSVIAGGVRWNADGQPDSRVAPIPPKSGVLSAAQAGAHLRVSAATVINWCKNGRLKGERDEHGHWRIRVEDLPEAADV